MRSTEEVKINYLDNLVTKLLIENLVSKFENGEEILYEDVCSINVGKINIALMSSLSRRLKRIEEFLSKEPIT